MYLEDGTFANLYIKFINGILNKSIDFTDNNLLKRFREFLIENEYYEFYWDEEEEEEGIGFQTRNLVDMMMIYEANVYREIANKGGIVVCSAGNDGEETNDNFYPADCLDNISVSGVEQNYEKAEKSNYGVNVSFCAPYYFDFIKEVNGESIIKRERGTSFSAPYIAAACALVKTEHPEYSKDQIIEVLKDNCIDLGDKGRDKYYGYGFVDFRTNMFSKSGGQNENNLNKENSNVSKVTIKKIPDKLIYYDNPVADITGEDLIDLTGGQIKVHYKDGNTEIKDMTEQGITATKREK